MDYFVGLDLGQPSEPTAVAVVERGDDDIAHYAVRHLRRFPAGTPYPAIGAALAVVLAEPALSEAVVVADITAVGRPVLKLLRRAGVERTVTPILLRSGHDATLANVGTWLVPKVELVGTLQALLQERRLKVAEALPDAATLMRELMNFKIKLPAAGTEPFSAWREGLHDDLVFAVGIAVWKADRRRVPMIW